MSVKSRKAGLVISWHKSLSILAPWKKGNVNKDAVLDTDVVLTKMKLFSHLHERLLEKDDSSSPTSAGSVSEQRSDPTKSSEVTSHQPGMESSSDYLSALFSNPQPSRLYKFESEDSGVELPSGANSPSTPTGSEKSFVVHSRESSCDSGTVTYTQTSESQQQQDTVGNSSRVAGDPQDDVLIPAGDLHMREDVHVDQGQTSGIGPEEDEEVLQEYNTERTCSEDTSSKRQSPTKTYQDQTETSSEPEPCWRSGTSESLEEYMDHCCRLSKAQQVSANPLGSGLGYLEHICQLLEKISQLQETNLQLQRQICCLQKDCRVTKTKKDFFLQHCSCGAAGLAFHDSQKRNQRSDCLSPSGTLSDLSTIPEVTRHPLIWIRRDMISEDLTQVPLWRKSLNQQSYTEGEVQFKDSTEGLSTPHPRLSEYLTWGRFRDLVRKTKLRNQSWLGMTPSSLKMSCPQLYRPDLEPVEPAVRNTNRNSMVALGSQSKLDFHWHH
ncbi:uncharacterized protein LOC141795320 [Halichoeres trimaculatus]|uniref:uncharacterized protein LOC141795320 n=1 Tax=Halichoeres trimaculatus TaxID=147232 RepID=UPI003D9E0C02